LKEAARVLTALLQNGNNPQETPNAITAGIVIKDARLKKHKAVP
jgi:hypothetical protein